MHCNHAIELLIAECNRVQLMPAVHSCLELLLHSAIISNTGREQQQTKRAKWVQNVCDSHNA
jgi:hypothetical protein